MDRDGMTDKEIMKMIRHLARDECCSYYRGKCLETDEPCHVINPRYTTIHDGTVDCDYLLNYVLPADWELKDLVWYAIWANEEAKAQLPDGMKECVNCHQAFIPTHPKQKYCKGCGEIVNRKKSRERMQEKRHSFC